MATQKNAPAAGDDEGRNSIAFQHQQTNKTNAGNQAANLVPGPWGGPAVNTAPERWPVLDDTAVHGLAGDVVRTIEPHSEADPVAILVQFLVAFGSIIERTAYYPIEGDRHYTNIFAVLVGATAKARKGTSWGRVRQVCEQADAQWVGGCLKSGLSSGEGLIEAVRDGDAGEGSKPRDKRLLVQESEFAALLRVMGRQGNTISPVIRDAWDRGDLRIMTKNCPATATGAHISIVGHVTGGELVRNLDDTEAGNGFANRFLFVCVKRSKELPFGGSLEEHEIERLAERTRKAAEHALTLGEVPFSDDARPLWEDVYGPLSEGKPGLVGAVTARAEAQVMRLALLYALLDCADEIRPEHLKAALALWDYCEASARHIFGDATGDPVADKIMAALRTAGPKGMTRTDIRELFKRHAGKERVEQALATLQEAGKVACEKESTRGRPTERWYAVKAAEGRA